jgi:hypothetical protein
MWWIGNKLDEDLSEVSGPAALRPSGPDISTRIAASTSRRLGFTSPCQPMTTVGAVSLPRAIERTFAAAAGSSQILMGRYGTPAWSS